MQREITHWNFIRAVAIKKKIICLLEKDKKYFVFLSDNDHIIVKKKANSLELAEQYFQNLLKSHKIDLNAIKAINP